MEQRKMVKWLKFLVIFVAICGINTVHSGDSGCGERVVGHVTGTWKVF